MGNLKKFASTACSASGYNRANLEYAPMTNPESTLPSACAVL